MIKLGVIGYGRRMRHVLASLARFNAGTRVTAVLDPRVDELRRLEPDGLAAATAYADIDALLDSGVDGVLIGTRCSLHTPYAIRVLERHLPLFLEKPIAISWEQLADLQAAADRSRSPVVVSFPLRLSAMCQTARAIIEADAIGTVEQVQAVNNVPFYAGGYYHGWMRDDQETGGLWLQKATHDLDYITYLVGRPPARVCAMEAKTVFRGEMPAGLRCVDCPRQAECPESPVNLFYLQGVRPAVEPNDWLCSFAVDTGNHDSASAIIEYAGGMHAVYSQNFYTRRGAAARGASLIGYRGTVQFDWYRNELTVHHHHTSRVERHRFEDGAEGHHGGDKELVYDFLQVLTGGGRSRAPLAAGILSAQLCLMARDACRTGAYQEYHHAGQVHPVP